MSKYVIIILINVIVLLLQLYHYFSFHNILTVFDIVAIVYWFCLVIFSCYIISKKE